MSDLDDGGSVDVAGSGSATWTVSRQGSVYQCTCPGWRFQRLPVDLRTCKHLRALRGDAAESERTRGVLPQRTANAGTTVPAGLPGKTTAPRLLLAQRWSNDLDIEGWWMSEKLDGVRAFWDGERFWSRQGNEFLAPEWFTERLPAMPMDGELFAGRGAFQRCVSIVRRQDRSDDWRTVEFLVFDAPTQPGGFEARSQVIEAVLAECGIPHVRAVAHEACDGLDHLEEELRRVEALGAEGLMLRQPGSPYEAGRSWTLLKVKSFQDAEARVVGHQEGSGKHLGRLGALLTELPSGVRFKVGTGFTDAQRDAPPAIGSVVTFRYQEMTDGGVPRFPSFVSERIDLSWDQVTSESRRASPTDGAAGATRTLPVPPVREPPVILVDTTPPSAPMPVAVEEPPPGVDAEGNIYLEFLKGNSVRYWEIEWEGRVVHVEYGRVDKPPHTETRTFDRPVDAARYAERQIQAKREKGYVDAL